MKKNYKKLIRVLCFAGLAACLPVQGQITLTFTYTGAMQSFTVPGCVATVSISVKGAQGGPSAGNAVAGGLGGYAFGVLPVNNNDVLNIYVGGSTTGFNGGGDPGSSPCTGAIGGKGGGASDVRLNGTALANRVIVGAGGGGGGGDRINTCGRGTGGGGGGGYYGGGGGAGYPSSSLVVPTGGTQTAGGIGGTSAFSAGQNGFPGVLGIGGNGGFEISSAQSGNNTALTGGNGGGLTGDPGQVTQPTIYTGHSGAGGSSYVGTLTNTIITKGSNTGNGVVVISYFTNGAGVNASMSNTNGICPGGSVVLSAGGVPTFTWVSGPQNSNYTVSPTVPTSYTVMGTNTLGCISSAVLNVSVNPNPIVTAATSPTFICVGGSAVLSAGGASTYSWDTGPTQQTISVNPVATTVYTVTGVSTAGCSSTETVMLNVNPITLSVSPSTSVCLGSVATLTANATGATSIHWSTGSPFAQVTVTPNIQTIYYVTSDDANHCQHSGSVTVGITQIPVVTATASRTLMCKGESVTLTGGGAANYTWTTGSTTYTTGVVTVTLSSDITYYYTITGVTNGCVGTNSLSIKVNKCSGLAESGAENGVRVFPNPSNGLFTLSLDGTLNNSTSVNIYNISGKLIRSQAIDQASTRIDLSKEPNGVYFVDLLRDGHSVKVTRLIKE